MSQRKPATRAPGRGTLAPDRIIEIHSDDEEVIAIPAPHPGSRTQPVHVHPPQQVAPGELEAEELQEPFVDIHELFAHYNRKHFGGRITNTYIEYSSRMTLCAGTCTFRGPLGGCRIALSEPLLKFRPRSDLRSTLLHEMIHALLFVTEGVAVRDGVDGHGPKFMAHARRISEAEGGGVNITPYHTFQDEVDVYRVHHWQCERCAMLIKRAMNRVPAPRDQFWPRHQQVCGGAFVKTREPEKKVKVSKRKPKNKAVGVDKSCGSAVEMPKDVMRTYRIDSMLSRRTRNFSAATVPCPVCNARIPRMQLNEHLDTCLTPGLLAEGEEDGALIPPSDDDVAEVPTEIRSSKRGRDCGRRRENNVEEIEERGSMRSPNGEGLALHLSHANTEVHQEAATKRPRPHVGAPEGMGRHPQRLVALAIDPLSVEATMFQDLLNRPQRRRNSSSRNGTDDVVSLLTPRMTEPSSHDLLGEARAQMQPLLQESCPDKEVSLLEAAKRMHMDAASFLSLIISKSKQQRDGRFELSNEALELLNGTKRPPAEPCHVSEHRMTSKLDGKTPGIQKSIGAQKACDAARGRGKIVESVAQSDRTEARNAPDVTHQNTNTRQDKRCPVCDARVCRDELEDHVDECLTKADLRGVAEIATQEETGDPVEGDECRCPLCDVKVPKVELDSHVEKCLNDHGMGESASIDLQRTPPKEASPMAECPICGIEIARGRLQLHVEQCLRPAYAAPPAFSTTDAGVEALVAGVAKSSERVNSSRPHATGGAIAPQCPVCGAEVARDQLESHVASCMLSAGLGDAF